MASSIDRLLDALSKKLPADAKQSTIELAFRAALDGLPQSKTRDKLLLRQASYIRQLTALVQAKKPSEGGTADASADAEQEDEAKDEEQEDQEEPEGRPVSGAAAAAAAAYKGVDGSSPLVCLQRCESLLAASLAGINPAARAGEALEGLLAMLPPERPADAWELDVGGLQLLAGLLPRAAAALAVVGREDPPAAWRRFLGLAVGSVLRVEEELPEKREEQVLEVAARLGGAAALLGCAAAARTALRIALAGLGPVPVAKSLLARLVPAVLPLLRAAFGRGLEAGSPKATRGDLVALLSALRLLKLASRAGLGGSAGMGLSEARKTVIASLGRDFDATPLLPELRHLTEEHASVLRRPKALRKRLAACMAGPRSAPAAAAVAVDVLEALHERLQQATLSRLAACSGLPIGEDEEVDTQAAAAKARGDLFFEDVAGHGGPADAAPVSSAASEAATQARKRALGSLEGLEELRRTGLVESKGKSSPSKRKPKAVAATGSNSQGEDLADADEGGGKRLRRRRKSSS